MTFAHSSHQLSKLAYHLCACQSVVSEEETSVTLEEAEDGRHNLRRETQFGMVGWMDLAHFRVPTCALCARAALKKCLRFFDVVVFIFNKLPTSTKKAAKTYDLRNLIRRGGSIMKKRFFNALLELSSCPKVQSLMNRSWSFQSLKPMHHHGDGILPIIYRDFFNQ